MAMPAAHPVTLAAIHPTDSLRRHSHSAAPIHPPIHNPSTVAH